MRMRAKLTIVAVAAGLALTACGAARGPASGTHPRSHAGALSQQHVQQAGLTVSDIKDLAQMKRDHAAALLKAAERAQCR
jgi:outer membrane PBP1 activator LpoA protein